MPGWLKALLIVVIIIVLLVVGVVVGGVVWWSRNKDKLVGRVKEVATEGRQFGRSTDSKGCVDETVSRYKKEPGFTTAISNSIFTRACLETSRPTPGFCDDVPKASEFMKSVEWRKSQCTRVDLGSDKYCPQMFQPVQEFCERGARRSSGDSNTNSQ
jgi:hypothetical protein